MNNKKLLAVAALEHLFPAPDGHRAVAYWIPIEMRQKVLADYRDLGISVRLRYRGSRIKSIGREMPRIDGGTYRRTRHQANQDCLLADATHFSVYYR
jgi:hypothetical protein